jgi:hypothetical protein
MLISLMTGAPGRSQFLLEDVMDFKKKLNFELSNSSNLRPDHAGG